MSTLRTYNLQNPDSSNVNIELTQGSGAVVAGVATFSSNVRVSGNLTVGGVLTYEDVTNIDSVGIITARAGINVTGGNLTVDAFSNTANNYLSLRNGYVPSSSGGMGFMSADHSGTNADGIAIYGHDGISLHTAQTERVRVSSTGKFGIGTNNPDDVLTVSGTDAFIKVDRSNGNPGIDFRYNGSTTNRGLIDVTSTGDLRLAAGGNTERLRISSTGQLHLNGANTSTTGTSATDLLMANSAAIRFRKGDNSAWINSVGLDSNNNLKLGWGGSTSEIHFGISGIGDQMFLDSGGRLLLGTTTEGYVSADDFTVAGSGDSGITIRSGSSSEGSIMFSDATSGTGEYVGWINYNHGSNFMRFFTNATERLRILSNGRVAIGDVTANSQLDVHGGDGISITSSGDTFLQSRTTGTTGTNYLEFKDSGGGSGAISYHHNGNSMRFKVAGSEALRIDSAGRLLHGTTSSSSITSFVLQGNSDNSASAAGIYMQRGTATPPDGQELGNIYFADSGGGTGAIILGKRDGGTWSGSSKPGRIEFWTTPNGATSGNERLRIDSAGTIKCGTSSVLKAEINSAISGHQFISQCDDNNNGFEIYQQHGSTTTRNTFAVYANTGAGGSQELQFSVRGDGCVTKPKSPAFAARRSGDINISTSGNTDVVFNDELIDNGNNYNPSNGRFTASIAGTYYFGVNLYVGFSVTAVRVMHSTFNKNGSSYAAVDLFGGVSNAAGTHYHPTGSSGMLIDLNVNDYVTFNLGTLSVSGSGNTFLYGTNGTRFFGYLVG